MSKTSWIFLSDSPKIIKLTQNNSKLVVGFIEEITSKEHGADMVNIARIHLDDNVIPLHHHKNHQETYLCITGVGQLFLNDDVMDFQPGDRVIIQPNVIHSIRPKKLSGQMGLVELLCICAPAFDPDDEYIDPRGTNW